MADVLTELRSDKPYALGEPMNRLAEVEPRLERVMAYRFFPGLTEAEIAEVLGLTVRTVQCAWSEARMLPRRALAL